MRQTLLWVLVAMLAAPPAQACSATGLFMPMASQGQLPVPVIETRHKMLELTGDRDVVGLKVVIDAKGRWTAFD